MKTSRDEAVDEYAKRGEWPPGEIDHDCKGEIYATNAVEFIEHNVGPMCTASASQYWYFSTLVHHGAMLLAK